MSPSSANAQPVEVVEVVDAQLVEDRIEPAEPKGNKAPRLLRKVPLSYPEEAKEEGLHADVSVLVDVSASGGVTGARVESGPDVFHAAALEAALRLEFAAGLRDGTATAMTTRVWLHFVPPEPGKEDQPEILEQVVIVGHSHEPDRQDVRTRKTLTEEDVERSAGADFGETVAEVPGVRMAQGTADAAKPIIRGQHERRLLVLYDGVRHESQKWGPDHATEIDPFSAGSIAVIRGAAGARYGPDAMGGVVLVGPPKMRTEPGIGGRAQVAFSTNGLRPYGAFRLDAAPKKAPGLSLRVEGSGTIGASLDSPNYNIGNTASRTWNVGGAVGYRWGHGNVRFSWHHHDRKMGVFYGVKHPSPDDFRAQLELDIPVTAALWSRTYTIDRAYQEVAHDVGVLHGDFFGNWGELEATYAFQLNDRKEFESVRENITGPQFDFTLRTHSLDVLYKHPSLPLSFGRLSGGIGLQGGFQENIYRGLSLLPNYRGFSGGIFLFQRLSLARADIEAAARLDGLSRTSFLRERDFEAHQRRDSINAEACTEGESTFRCPATYGTGSLSVGTILHLVPEVLDLKVDLSSASRFPDVDELFLLGTAPSFPVFAYGNPSLGVERAWGATMTLGLRSPFVEFEISGFGQLIDDYIYFAPQFNDSGNPAYEVTIRGTWPGYAYSPINAAFYGVDGEIKIWPGGPIGLDIQGAVIRGQDRATSDHLVGIPPDQLIVSLVGRPPDRGPFTKTELRVEGEFNDQQRWVKPEQDIAPAPPGYILLGASLETTLDLKIPIRIGIDGTNLLNTSYRDYTSLLRYYAEQPGWDLRIRVGTSF
jgi:iron complex outermembrane receptor protein